MKKYPVYLIIVLFIISCGFSKSNFGKNIANTGEMIVKKYKSDKFVNVNVNDSIKVNIKKDNSYNVNVHTDSAYIDYINVSVKGETLYLSMKKDFELKNPIIIVYISMPEVKKIEIDGSSIMNLNNMDSDNLYLEIKGSSRVYGEINANKLIIEGSDSSFVNLKGRAVNLKLKIDKNSKADLKNFVVTKADFEVKNGSEVELRVTESISADILGHSEVKIKGNPGDENIHIESNSDIEWDK
ncbi:MAG: DUF2807 domain-containing protein [Candidatus Mcinerneyibacterium aminivorans]|uniref:DUF2807 domain-containing protein n=1 Tax=Candidatus Mcinerneyibacterium aminivorans TaxID=2703815 RepID=A0A5D0MBS7_9BACT|nr:MAG: DUF2807 domain-containing protein [Candidatus Mcinerneyibacterium aminivorans]